MSSTYNQQSPELYGYVYEPPPLAPVKDPLEVRPYFLDLSNEMYDTSDSLVSVTSTSVSPSGTAGDLIVVSSEITAGYDPKYNPLQPDAGVQLVVASGVVSFDEPYTVSVLMLTELGYTYNRSLLIPVNNR